IHYPWITCETKVEQRGLDAPQGSRDLERTRDLRHHAFCPFRHNFAPPGRLDGRSEKSSANAMPSGSPGIFSRNSLNCQELASRPPKPTARGPHRSSCDVFKQSV